MKFFVFCGLLAVALASRHHLRRTGDLFDDVKPFRSGYEYRYRYESQISSGIGSIEQQSTYRLASTVRLHFDSDRTAVLRLENVKIGVLNDETDRKITWLKPGHLFESKDFTEEQMRELAMPLKFEYIDGMVEKIYFNGKDSVWSKNVKRAILNMLQLNLARRNSETRGLEFEEEKTNLRMFSLPEMTLEGDCLTTYTLNKAYEREEEENKLFNVTKSIDFSQCKKIAALRYGPHDEKLSIRNQMPEVTEQREMDRTTVLRFELIGTPEKYAIGRVQVHATYVYGLEHPMKTIATNELIFESVEEERSLKNVHVDDKEESLMYSIAMEEVEKRFYQYGDEEFTREASPFARISHKVAIAKDLINTIVDSTKDKVNGIETEAARKLQKLVIMLRICTGHDLEEIARELDTVPAKSVFVDACAVAATRNTIHFLVENILAEKIPTEKAVQMLQQLATLPAVSSAQIEQILRLTKSHVVAHKSALRQSSWLVAGSMIAQLCRFENSKMCPRAEKEKYNKMLIHEYKRAETTYDKILALKTIGNAAIDISVFELEKIIVDVSITPIVRQQAIDSLRRLRHQMPRKIQRILLPVFKNTQEKPEVRMIAFSMLMHTIPDKAVLDQLTYVLMRERSRHVQSFVVSALKVYARSPLMVERELARHLQASLKIIKITEDAGCRYFRVPIYSEETREGLFFNLASIFSASNPMPKHLSLSMDSLVSGVFDKNTFELSFTQTEVEGYLRKLFEESEQDKSYSRSSRLSSATSARRTIDEVFDKLSIKTRRDSEQELSPFGMLCLRLRDVDYMILPISDDTMPEPLKRWINGEKISLPVVLAKLAEGTQFNVYTLANLYERTLRIATVTGFPLRLAHSLPVIASVEGAMQLRMTAGTPNLRLRMQPRINGMHSYIMEICTPIVNTGVEVFQSLSLNAPIDTEITVSMDSDMKETKIKFNLPEEKVRLFKLITLPVTFVRHFDEKTKMHSQLTIKTIRNPMFEMNLMELKEDERSEEQALRVRGLIHKPADLDFVTLMTLCKTTENQLMIEFVPLSHTPKAAELTLAGKLFKSLTKTLKHNFESFYDEDDTFETVFEQEYHGDSHSERRSKLDRFLSSDDFSTRKMYEHQIRSHFKTIGGRHTINMNMLVKATCDNTFSYCHLNTNVKRSPMLRHEDSEWSMNVNGEWIAPKSVRRSEDLSDNKHDKLVMTWNAEWGCDNKDTIKMLIQGERAIERSMPRDDLPLFLNKYDIVADYSLSRDLTNRMAQMFMLFKTYNFWAWEAKELENPSRRSRTNRISASVLIDPRTRQHLNLSIKTPTELVHFTDLRLPMRMQPLKLVRFEKEWTLDSAMDLFDRVSETTHAECRVNGERIKTFDQVAYKAPIGNCYTVVAKDCARKQFLVLMKAINESDKKIKIVTPKRVIEVEPVNGRLVVRINDEAISSIELLADKNQQYSEDYVRIQVRDGVIVHFDGREVSVKLAHYYQNSQCGLCGHFDGDKENEFRRNDDEITEDLSAFHRSYAMLEDEGCDRSEDEKLYSQERLFKKMPKKTMFKDDWDSAFDSDEEDMFETDDDSKNVIKVTKVIEYESKICFSLEPVQECRRGFTPEDTKVIKITYGCMPHSSRATKLAREARTKDISNKLDEDSLKTHTASVRAVISCSEF